MAESCRTAGSTRPANQQAKIPSTLTPFVPESALSPMAGAAVPAIVAATERPASPTRPRWKLATKKSDWLGFCFRRLFPLPGRLWLVARLAPVVKLLPNPDSAKEKVEAGSLLVGLASGYFHAVRQPTAKSHPHFPPAVCGTACIDCPWKLTKPGPKARLRQHSLSLGRAFHAAGSRAIGEQARLGLSPSHEHKVLACPLRFECRGQLGTWPSRSIFLALFIAAIPVDWDALR